MPGQGALPERGRPHPFPPLIRNEKSRLTYVRRQRKSRTFRSPSGSPSKDLRKSGPSLPSPPQSCGSVLSDMWTDDCRSLREPDGDDVTPASFNSQISHSPDKYQATDGEGAEMYIGNILETVNTCIANYDRLPVFPDLPREKFPIARIRIESVQARIRKSPKNFFSQVPVIFHTIIVSHYTIQIFRVFGHLQLHRIYNSRHYCFHLFLK